MSTKNIKSVLVPKTHGRSDLVPSKTIEALFVMGKIGKIQ